MIFELLVLPAGAGVVDFVGLAPHASSPYPSDRAEVLRFQGVFRWTTLG